LLFPYLKYTHVTTVVITALLFLLRLRWALTAPARLQKGWIRIIPHVNDATLFFTGLGMAVLLHQYPFVNGWLTAKLTALLGYIILGTVALKRGRSRRQQVIAASLAILCFTYIVGVAITRDPRSLLLLFA